MILKQLHLQNIRSYTDQTVDFPLGKTLFEGDIGSGKSTILMAIEFGLFGLGSEKAASLLRIGETEGGVGITFEAGGKEYTVQRKLLKKRGNAFSQEDCILKTPAGAFEYSPSEIKEKVLELLNFNEPSDPKAQSVIYRYAIYTPQEEMKAILSLRADSRLQTLRRAFSIEDYLIAKENSKELGGEVRNKSRELTGAASDLHELKTKLVELGEQIEGKQADLQTQRKELERKSTLLKTLEEEILERRKEQLSLSGTAGKREALQALLEEKKREIAASTRQLSDLSSKVAKLEPTIRALEALPNPSERTQAAIVLETSLLEKRQKELISRSALVSAKFGDYSTILQKGVCPTCDRPIEAHDFKEKLQHRELEQQRLTAEIDECETKLAKSKEELELKRKFEQAEARLVDLKGNLSEYKEGMRTWEKQLEEASKASAKAEQDLILLRAKASELEKVEAELAEKESQYKKEQREQQLLANKLASFEAAISTWEKQRNEYELTVKKKQQQKEKSEKLNEYHMWIQEYFVPTVDSIEKQVMTGINLEFNQHFQRWFAMLVEDPGKQAKVDENFTPIIQQDGVDQEVAFLSGGEKTSVALAYRLTLNSIVRKLSLGMQSNLIILDEPTDGFSKEQLGKVREILDELDSPQVILVSHEKELESFADQIFKITKSDGNSKIVAA